MEKGILDSTGKPIDHWIKLVKGQNFEKHGQIMNFLKKDHGFTHGYANYVAHKARESDAGSHDADELVTSQYHGRESLKPIYEKLVNHAAMFGDDVEIAPKKASVSLRRKRQFALIQPSTKTRVDLGLKFNYRPVEGRLEGSGPFGAMCTHRVQLTEESEVDDDVIAWLKAAYEEAG